MLDYECELSRLEHELLECKHELELEHAKVCSLENLLHENSLQKWHCAPEEDYKTFVDTCKVLLHSNRHMYERTVTSLEPPEVQQNILELQKTIQEREMDIQQQTQLIHQQQEHIRQQEQHIKQQEEHIQQQKQYIFTSATEYVPKGCYPTQK